MTPARRCQIFWIGAFATLSMLIAHNTVGNGLEVNEYGVFWVSLLATIMLGVLAMAESRWNPYELGIGITYFLMLMIYLFSIRDIYAANSPIYGLDTYFEIGAIRQFQASGFRPGGATPFAVVTDFPLIHIFTIFFIEITGMEVVPASRFLEFALSVIAWSLFILCIRVFLKDLKWLLLWSLVFVSSFQLLVLNFSRQLLGLVLLLLLVYLVLNRSRFAGVRNSVLLLISIAGLTLAHQLSGLVGLLVMLAIIATPWILRRLSSKAILKNGGQRRTADITLIFGVILIGYWFLITLSIAGLLARVNYILSTGESVFQTGYQANMRLLLGYAILVITNGGLGLYVLGPVLWGRARSVPSPDGLALVGTSGVLVIMSIILPRAGVGVDLSRLLLFVEVLVPIGFVATYKFDKKPLQAEKARNLPLSRARSHQQSVKRRVSLVAVAAVTLIVGNMAVLPPSFASPTLSPYYAGGEFRVYVTRQELAAVEWLPNDSIGLGDHYLSMSSLFLQHGMISVNQGLITHSTPLDDGYEWFVYDVNYQNRILDRCNLTYATLSLERIGEFDSNPWLVKAYDNGEIWIYTSNQTPIKRTASVTFSC